MIGIKKGESHFTVYGHREIQWQIFWVPWIVFKEYKSAVQVGIQRR